jgi:L-fucono-1,5-lactonase
MRIDTHQHFWQYDPVQYDWMKPNMEVLKTDHLPEHLKPLMKACGIDGTIAVQARQTLEETRWLLELADRFPFIKGVVGWVDLRSPDVKQKLQQLSSYPKFRGVRHIVQDEPDDRFMLDADFLRGLEQLAEFNLTYDFLLYPRHLPVAVEVVKRFPKQPFVLDHISKPLIRKHELAPWDADIRKLAKFQNVSCKISGMVTEGDWKNWQPADFKPYIDVIVDSFGTNRIMVGSDWPVCTLAASYSQVIQLVIDYFEAFSKDEQEHIWSVNAMQFYGLHTSA